VPNFALTPPTETPEASFVPTTTNTIPALSLPILAAADATAFAASDPVMPKPFLESEITFVPEAAMEERAEAAPTPRLSPNTATLDGFEASTEPNGRKTEQTATSAARRSDARRREKEG
jgi:hypothetical protein